jgi:hypothetical protein
MSAILKQRNFLVKQIFEITDRSVKVIIKNPATYFEGEFKYEDIGTREIRTRKQDVSSLILSIGSFLVNILLVYLYFYDSKETPWYAPVICFGLFVVFTFMAYFNYEHTIKLFMHNGRVISFYRNSPNETEVDEFLESLKRTQKAYLLGRYAKDDPYLAPEQISDNLNWLWKSTIINIEELGDLRTKLLPKPVSENAIGFKPENKTK